MTLPLLRRVRRIAGRFVDDALARHTASQTATMRAEIASLRTEIISLRGGIDERLRHEVDRAVAEVRAVEIRDRRCMVAAGEREAVHTSARFARTSMAAATTLPTPRETLAHALSLAPTGGMALEFGVYTGGTLRAIAEHRADGRVWGFDSFTGLPEPWRAGFDTGAFSVDGLPDVPCAQLVVGLFDDTLSGFLAEHPGPVDFLHVDADLYSSAVTVLDQVGPRLRPGSIVLFDEFLNFPGWEEHEARAWWEYTAKQDVAYSYVCYTVDNEQVAVRIEE